MDRKHASIPDYGMQSKYGLKNSDMQQPSSTKDGMFKQIIMTVAVLVMAAACGMPIGYSAVLLPQLYNTSEHLSMDTEISSWFASLHSLATPIGSFTSGSTVDILGRRRSLLLSTAPLLVGWIILATAQSHSALLVGRFTAGVAVGFIGPSAQILIAEIAEPRLRGMLVGAPFVAYSIGILLVYTLGFKFHWRTVAWLGIILPIVGGSALYFTPESPTWLIKKGLTKRATSALLWLRGDENIAELELNELVKRQMLEHSSDKATKKRSSSIMKSLIIINGFNLFQICSGTFLIVFYAVDILTETGAYSDNMLAAVITAVVRLAFTVLFCTLLLLIQRRTMVLFSGVGSGISAAAISIHAFLRRGHLTIIDSYISGICMLVYIAFNTGFLILPGIMIGELLPVKIRGFVAGYIFAAFNAMLFCLTKIFPYLQTTFKTYGLFAMFSAANFAASTLMYLMLPETKYMTLSQIEEYFQGKNWLWPRRHQNLFKAV